MAHKCVHCGKNYPDAAPELLSGCSCGSRFFLFYKKEDTIKEVAQIAEELSKAEVDEMEADVREMVGDMEKTQPIILDFESIRVRKPGKFEIDLVSLFRRKPLVYKIEEGRYVIDLASTFQLSKGSAKKKGSKPKKK